MKTELFLATLAWTLVEQSALADERSGELPIVTAYDAPPECPDAVAFGTAVRAEVSRREGSRARALQVRVAVARNELGYSATATALDEQGNPLGRTVHASTCAEVVDIAATLVALAQSDPNVGDTASVTQVSAPAASSSPWPTREHPPTAASETEGHWVNYALSLGYGSFATGPTHLVIRGSGQQTTFNPARGARLGIGVSHAFGWWRPSVEVSAAYYRQGTTTVSDPPSSAMSTSATPTDIGDRDVLQATLDACPLRLKYSFLSLMPCASFSMIQSPGNSGYTSELETGLGGSLRLRGEFAKAFFVEALGAAVGVTSSYEPPSAGARIFYALSLGTTIQ